jgi:hypothetical protein
MKANRERSSLLLLRSPGSIPATLILPTTGRMMPAARRNTVDFPEPLRPSRHTFSPLAILKDTLLSRELPSSKAKLTFSNSIIMKNAEGDMLFRTET